MAQEDLQALINNTPAGGTLVLPDFGIYSCNCLVSKPITIVGSGSTNRAKVTTPNAGPAIDIPPGTRDVRLEGFAIDTSPLASEVFDIVRIGTHGPTQDQLSEVPTNIALDDMWIQGLPTQNVQRGVAANGANVSITNSRITEIHGQGYDTQAIAVWNGPGPFRFNDNHLEAAGENILFGGAAASIVGMVPTDIEIRRNTLRKPLSWKVGDPSYAGIHWSIKNLLELKVGRNVIIDGNVLENCWGDAQIGYAVLFTLRNEDGANPWNTIENVSFTNNTVRNSEQGIQLLGLDNNNQSLQAAGLRIANNLFIDVRNWFVVFQKYNDVTFEHNTHFQGHNAINLSETPVSGFVYRNNLTFRSPSGFGVVFGGGVGEGTVALDLYAPGYDVRGNIMAGALDRIYPTGNFFPATLEEVQLGSDYRLLASSLFKGMGTDGTDPGVNMDQLLAAQSSGGPTPTPTPTPEPSPTPPTTPTDPLIGTLRLNVPWNTTEAKENAEAEKQRLEGWYFYKHQSGKKATFIYTGVKLP